MDNAPCEKSYITFPCSRAARPAGFQIGLVASSALLRNAWLNPSPRVPIAGRKSWVLVLDWFSLESEKVNISEKETINKRRKMVKNSHLCSRKIKVASWVFTFAFVSDFKMEVWTC